MKPRILLLILMAVVAAPASANDPSHDMTGALRLFNPAYADHIVLVGFADKQINRVYGGSLSSSYRRRGSYQSSTWSRRITEQIAQEYHLSKITEWPISEVGIHCAVYLVPHNQSVISVIEHLVQDERIDLVQIMNNFSTNALKYNDPYLKLQSNLRNMSIDEVHAKTTGQNITIGIIDTGVEIDHPELIGKVDSYKNFVASISPSFFNDKHGTAVAGIMVARSNNGTGIIGVAPDAKLVVLKACWPNDKDSYESICNSFTLALAVNKAIELGVDVLNMSLTGPYDPLLEILLNKAKARSIIVVAADPGFSRPNDRFPASLKDVIPVQTSRQSESVNLVQNLIIKVPGENILTTIPHSTYDFVSGSSLAAAHISGVIALLMQLHPGLTLAEARTILQKSISKITIKNSKQFYQGINIQTAVMELCKQHTCPLKL